MIENNDRNPIEEGDITLEYSEPRENLVAERRKFSGETSMKRKVLDSI